jgi:saccharopine dehydrogenase-like NADP-dependent oxidoreductase
VTVDGTKDGKKARAVYEMIDYRDEKTGLTAMMRGTALPASIICLMMARGETAIEEILARGMPLEVRFETG